MSRRPRIARVFHAIAAVGDAAPWVLLPLMALVILTMRAPAPATPAHVIFAPPPAATAHARQIVLCQAFLSHGAMVAAAQTHIPAPPSFCVVTN